MILTLQDFTIVTPIILLLTFYSSFKNGKPTCEKYLLNSCLYILSALCVFISSVYYQREKQLIPEDKLSMFSIGGLLLILLIIFTMHKTQNIVVKHLCLAFIVIFLGIVSDKFYEKFDQQLIDETLIRTSVLSAIALAIAIMFPHILKESLYTKLVYVFIFLVIAHFIDIIFFQSSHKITFSYIFILIFFTFIMYDSKFIMQRAKTCKINAVYVGGTLDILLDLINLFRNLLDVGDN